MNDTQFLNQVDTIFSQIEALLDQQGERLNFDLEYTRQGNVLEIELEPANKLILNSQLPLHEIWIAGHSGGFHFHWQEESWRDVRTGQELMSQLQSLLREQSGKPVDFDFPKP